MYLLILRIDFCDVVRETKNVFGPQVEIIPYFTDRTTKVSLQSSFSPVPCLTAKHLSYPHLFGFPYTNRHLLCVVQHTF